MHILIQTKLLL